MKKQLLNLGVAFAAMLLFAGNAFSQLTAPVFTTEAPAITSGPMTIDGYADEDDWSAAIPVTIRFTQPADYGGDADMSGSYKLCWNNVGMYIFFDIKDDIAVNWAGVDGTNPWTWDNVELFFNFDTTGVYNSGKYAPDGIQMRYNRGYDDDNGQPGWGNGETAKAEGYDVVPTVYKQIDGAGQWQVEILVPWLYILASGTKQEDIVDSIAAHKAAFGFDVSLADSDTDGQDHRDCQYAWDDDGGTGDEDNAWQDVRKFGILTLTGARCVSTTIAPSVDGFNVYPNPVKNVVNFNNLNGATQITLINAIGQTVKVVDVTTNDVVVNVSDLARGTYVAIIKSNDVTRTSKIIKK